MIRYVAFLRGINVGGHKPIKMADLSRLFTSFGLQNVKTYIASGNVLFETPETDPEVVSQRVEEGLRKALGYETTIILRTMSELVELVSSDPFKDVPQPENVRLYVTFFAEVPHSVLKLPYESPQGEFQILKKTNREVFSVVFLSQISRSVDGMTFVEKEFGKASTTRNWNTVKKIVAL